MSAHLSNETWPAWRRRQFEGLLAGCEKAQMENRGLLFAAVMITLPHRFFDDADLYRQGYVY